MVFCRQKLPNKDLSWSKSEKVYTRLYLNKLESIMRALSDALPTAHRAMLNPTLQLHFGCGRATPPVSNPHNWPSGRMQHFLFKIGQKSYCLPIKTQQLILTLEWYYRSLYCRSKAMILKKMANLKVISSSATLNWSAIYSLRFEPIDGIDVGVCVKMRPYLCITIVKYIKQL